MKKSNHFFTIALFASFILSGCGGSSPEKSESLDVYDQIADSLRNADSLEMISNAAQTGEEVSEDTEVTESTENNETETAEMDDAIRYESYKFPKKYKEEELEKGPSHALDFRDRDGDKFIGIKFSDGHSGTLVLRDGNYYNYTIRKKTEVRFATKEDALQRIWDDSRLLQDAGAVIGTVMSNKSGPRKKDGTLDMRYKENK
jgi:hypothetical protein